MPYVCIRTYTDKVGEINDNFQERNLAKSDTRQGTPTTDCIRNEISNTRKVEIWYSVLVPLVWQLSAGVLTLFEGRCDHFNKLSTFSGNTR